MHSIQRSPRVYKPYLYTSQLKLEVCRYIVMRKDGKVHFEAYNGTGFAYNNNSITHYYLPRIA